MYLSAKKVRRWARDHYRWVGVHRKWERQGETKLEFLRRFCKSWGYTYS